MRNPNIDPQIVGSRYNKDPKKVPRISQTPTSRRQRPRAVDGLEIAPLASFEVCLRAWVCGRLRWVHEY